MNCQDCKHRIGDGHPYGDITCRVNGKYRYMGRECDTGEYAPIVSDKDLIKQLQSEVEGLKQRLEKAEIVCNATARYCNPADGFDYLELVDIVTNWQKAGD